jgi:hypothetical protein
MDHGIRMTFTATAADGPLLRRPGRATSIVAA